MMSKKPKFKANIYDEKVFMREMEYNQTYCNINKGNKNVMEIGYN